MRQNAVDPNDFRKKFINDLPGRFSIVAMVVLCAILFKPACNYGNEEISYPRYVIGTAGDNYGCYPVDESMIAGVMLAVMVLKMAASEVSSAVAKCRRTPEQQALVAAEAELKPVEGVHYLGLTNIACLHLPRLLMAIAVLTQTALMPWFNVAMDWAVREEYDDPDQGEVAAGVWGKRLLAIFPCVDFFVICLFLPVIKNLNFVNSETEALALSSMGFFERLWYVKDHFCVDHSQVKVVEEGEPDLESGYGATSGAGSLQAPGPSA